MSGELDEQDGTTPLADGEGPERPGGKLGRRALMLGAASGVGAAAALVVAAGPAGAGTGNGGTVQLGEVNNGATATTTVATSGPTGLQGITTLDGGQGLSGECDGAGGIGVYGIDAGSPPSNPGTGVHGVGVGQGVSGFSDAGTGVVGTSTTGVGITGTSQQSDGIQGFTSNTFSSGVNGTDQSTGGGHGVYGNSVHGVGVWGQTTADGSYGVAGADKSATGGYGLYGTSSKAGGVGILAQNTNASGTALEVEGVATFTRSGVATLARLQRPQLSWQCPAD